ncbi:hypothetical protein VTO42DRAFT_4097 [Malbranchea cinnamomea]
MPVLRPETPELAQRLEILSAPARPISEHQHQDELRQEVNRRLFHHMMTQEASQDVDVTEINTNPDLPALRLRAEPQDRVTRKKKRPSMTDVDKANIIMAYGVELKGLEARGTYKKVPRPKNYNGYILLLKWVWTYKFDDDGFLTKYKARLCVRGDLQDPTELDRRACTLAARAFRALMAIAAAFDLDMEQLDAVNTFCNSDIDELVYVEEPPEFKSREENSVLQLLKALYGLRRSPLLWYRELAKALRELGFEAVDEEPCLFTDGRVFVFFYVDDIVLLARKGDRIYLEATKACLME